MKITDFLLRKSERDSAQAIWKQGVTDYANSINDYVAKGRSIGWDKVGEEPPEPDVGHLVEEALQAVREANRNNRTEDLRDNWPPAHAPLIPVLENNGQSIPTVCLLDDGSILARIGAPYEGGETIRIIEGQVQKLPDIGFFGRSPNRRYFAVANPGGIRIHDGWQGPVVATVRWPSGLEGLPKELEVAPYDVPPIATKLTPFPDGRRLLLVSESGVFVLSETTAIRLLPTQDQIREYAEWALENDPESSPIPGLSMEHGAVSRSGEFVAAGSQDGDHLIFDKDLEVTAKVGPMSEYPHYAVFSEDDSVIALNSCHFYNGVTRSVRTSLLPGLVIPAYEEDERSPILEDAARVYAGVSRDDEFIIGDAGGYVRAFSVEGQFRWEIFIGSSIGDIDISSDKRTLVVSTYAGFISLVDLDTGSQPDYQIGVGGHTERFRWIFWRNEKEPLRW